MPILEGLDGVQKMSKSLGNYIGMMSRPRRCSARLMSVSDDLMWRYFDLLSFEPHATIQGWRREVDAGANPRDIKFGLARRSWRAFTALRPRNVPRKDFIARFQRGAMPEEMPEVSCRASADGLAVANLLKEAGLTASTSEALRMIQAGAVRIDGERVADGKFAINGWQ